MAATEINTDNTVMGDSVPKVSVIVPAYNAEKYLERCLDSVAAQTMTDFECIIVDDGSTDRTGAIADDYAQNDPRFKVIHQPNGGVSVARQTGIDSATGVYTIQFDADDWVEANMLEELLAAAEKKDADMVICDINIITQFENIILSQKPKICEANVVLGQLMQDLHCSLCNKLIKRSCYQLYHIRFPLGKLSEDQYVCLCITSHPIIVDYTDKAVYHYDQTQNPGSLTKGEITSLARLRSLELFEATTDISKVQDYYDRAVLHIAYEVLSYPPGYYPNYSKVFRKHLSSIRRAEGYPFRVKMLVMLRIYGIIIPIQSIKQFLKSFLHRK